MLRRSWPLVLAAALAGTLTACSGDDGGGETGPQDPPASAFTSGGCAPLAPAVLEAGRQVRALGQEPPSEELQQALAASQAALRATPAPEVAAQVQELAAGLGFVRLRTASGTYGSDLADSVLLSYRTLVAACTGQPAPTAPSTAPSTAAPTP